MTVRVTPNGSARVTPTNSRVSPAGSYAVKPASAAPSFLAAWAAMANVVIQSGARSA